MKRLMTTLAVMVMIVTSAAAMSLSKARKEALFLSDKMAYELGLSISQYEAVYEINLDYFLGLYNPADIDGVYWMRRNADLRYVLSEWQWLKYTGIVDFYRPMSWVRRHTFSLVLRSRYAKNYFFYDRPAIYYSFRGGHNTGSMSFYAGREFHRPAQPGGQMHFGSSAPPAYGTVKPNSKSYPSYHFGEAKPATSHGTTRSDATTSKSTTQPANQNATTATRPQTFSGSQRGSNTTRSSVGTSAVPQRTTSAQRSASTTTAPQRSTSTSGASTSSGSTRSNSGAARGNSGGSRGR